MSARHRRAQDFTFHEAEAKCEISVQMLTFPVENLGCINDYRCRAWTVYFANTQFKKSEDSMGEFEPSNFPSGYASGFKIPTEGSQTAALADKLCSHHQRLTVGGPDHLMYVYSTVYSRGSPKEQGTCIMRIGLRPFIQWRH